MTDDKSLTGKLAAKAAKAAADRIKKAAGAKVIATQSGPPAGKCHCGKAVKKNNMGTCGKSACLKAAGRKMIGDDDD